MKYMSKTHFCHISPINYLHLTKGREVHLTLAHLVDNKVGKGDERSWNMNPVRASALKAHNVNGV